MIYKILFCLLCSTLIILLIASVILNLGKDVEFMLIGFLSIIVIIDEFAILEENNQEVNVNTVGQAEEVHKYSSQLMQKN